MTARLLALACLLVASLAAPPAASAEWLPSESGAHWTYEWTDSVYATTPTKERVYVQSAEDNAFTLAWSTLGQGNPTGSVTSTGSIEYKRTGAGLINVDWSSNLPPARFPVLCPSTTGCNNSLASTHYMLVWGSRSPVLPDPLQRGDSWNSVGGAQNDVAGASDYLGVERVSVPAFPDGVDAAKVRTEITQAGALGDPYGSGTRTVWWVYGVGPVKIEFAHAGGAAAPVGRSVLSSTNQAPKAAPSDVNWFPLVRGQKQTFRWRNSRHMRKPAKQRFTVSQVLNGSARVDVESLSGPIRVAGAYVFARRADGLTNISAFTRALSLVKWPALGPRSQPRAKRRRFFTPYDLMTFGINPVLSGTPVRGQKWSARRGTREFGLFGVTGQSRVVGMRTVKVPAGRFRALAVRSTLKQRGFRFGSGVRTSYFAPGKGLVKLVFRHRDRSISTVERLRR